MKKLLLLLALTLGIGFSGMARNAYTRDASILPEAAKATIANNFKAKVSLIKTEKTLGSITEYEVILSDGSEISFDKNGNWDNIDMPANVSVPKGFILKGMSDYVNKKHPGQKIVSIDKERNGFEIELSNGIDMKFDKNGNFIKYDD